MFDFPVPKIDILACLPIIVVVATGILALIVEMARPKRNNNAIVAVSLLGLVGAGVSIAVQYGLPSLETMAGMVVCDRFALSIQLLIVVSTALSVLFSEPYLREKRIPFGEFYPLVLWSASGAMVMASSRNLLTIFVGLEVLSISLYVMAGMSRSEQKSEESALKYFLLGAFASAFFLYGVAFVYGATGSLHLSALGAIWDPNELSSRGLLMFGLGLMLIGFGFKSGFVPFHQWTPDVYQGAPTNVSAFMAAGSKIGALAALWRVLEAVGPMSELWMPALFWIAVLTMCVGNILALVQRDVKRILGYSSIAHAGYILVAILAHAKDPRIGIGTITYYLLSYSLMTIGAFAVVSLGAKNGHEGTKLESLHGLYQRSPFAATSLIVFMASLIGVPPLAGFIGKLFIFNDALQAGLQPLAIVLAVNSVVSIYYYLGIARAALTSDGIRPTEGARLSLGTATACIFCVAGIFAAAVFCGPLTTFLGSH